MQERVFKKNEEILFSNMQPITCTCVVVEVLWRENSCEFYAAGL